MKSIDEMSEDEFNAKLDAMNQFVSGLANAVAEKFVADLFAIECEPAK